MSWKQGRTRYAEAPFVTVVAVVIYISTPLFVVASKLLQSLPLVGSKNGRRPAVLRLEKGRSALEVDGVAVAVVVAWMVKAVVPVVIAATIGASTYGRRRRSSRMSNLGWLTVGQRRGRRLGSFLDFSDHVFDLHADLFLVGELIPPAL